MTEPELIKAGDERVLVNGMTLPVNYRIVWEDNYKELKRVFDLHNVSKSFTAEEVGNMLATKISTIEEAIHYFDTID